MTTSERMRALLPVFVTVALASCSSPSAEPSSPAPSTTAPTSAQEALMAYERYWSVTQAAFAAPTARDWTGQLQAVATGPALESVLADVRNYAAFPAHTEGSVTRAPVVAGESAGVVEIVDCVDLGESRLVADATGESLDDVANRVPRYRFRAEVIELDQRWLVQRTEPDLDEPC